MQYLLVFPVDFPSTGKAWNGRIARFKGFQVSKVIPHEVQSSHGYSMAGDDKRHFHFKETG